MTIYDEVRQLRQSGDYQSAYNKAQEVKNTDPSCLWVYNQIGWCLYDMLKSSCSREQQAFFFERLQELVVLNQEHPLDPTIFKAVIWPIRSFVVTCVGGGFVAEASLFGLFAIIQQINFDTSDENYGVLLSAFVKAKEWSGLRNMIDWWNLDNLKPKDCEPYTTPEGRNVMSVAEQAYIAYSRILLKEWSNHTATKEVIGDFAERLGKVAIEHSDFQYPAYFQAKLLLAIGENENAINALMPFVKKKPKDYWVWDLLGDAQSDDDLKLSCYCKACTLQVKEDFLRKIHFKLCDLLIKKEMYSEASIELNHAKDISIKNGWKLPLEYIDYASARWYVPDSDGLSNSKFYEDNLFEAEQLIYSDKEAYFILISYVNKEKCVANFVTTNHEEGFFSYKAFPKKKRPKQGEILLCRMEMKGKMWMVYTIDRVENAERFEDVLIMHFSGAITKTPNGFCFINKVYVPADLIKDYDDKTLIKGIAIPNYNKKKQEWGWKAFRIECQ